MTQRSFAIDTIYGPWNSIFSLDSEMTTAASAFSPVESDDHAGALWIVAILGLMYSFLSGAIRMYIKRRVYGWDDYILVLATVRFSFLLPVSPFCAIFALTDIRLTRRRLPDTLRRSSRAHLSSS